MPNPQVLVMIQIVLTALRSVFSIFIIGSLAPLVQNRRLLKMKNPNFCWDDHYLIWRRERD